MSEQPVAFMSYVRFDDQHESGWLTEFCKILSGEVQIQTGERFHIFQDKKDIAWGENWKQRIVQSLDSVHFLIPIVTPGFFKSAACREEFELFVEREKRLRRNDLILPVYYVTCPVLNDEAKCEADPTARIIASRQRVDWRELRFESFASPQVRKTIARIAGQIVEATSRATSTDSPASRQPAHDRPKVSESSPSTSSSGRTAVQKRKRDNKPKEPTTRIVDALHRGNHVSITAALRASKAGDRILVRPGLYRESLVISKAVEIIGDGANGEVVIEATNAEVILFTANMGRIANLTLRKVGATQAYCVKIIRGRLELEGCNISNRSFSCMGVLDGADPRLRRNVIHSSGGGSGVLIHDNGLGTLEENEIFGNHFAGISIKTGGNPTLRRNRIHSGNMGGVLIHENGLGTLEDNEIYGNKFAGIEIREGANPTVRRNQIHSGIQGGIYIHGGGLGTLEDNKIYDNALAGIEIATGGNPLVRRNQVYDGKHSGIVVGKEGRGTIEENDVFGNAFANIDVKDCASPSIRRNRIHGSKGGGGIWLRSAATGMIEQNDIFENAKVGVEVTTKANPTVRRNRIHDGKSWGVVISDNAEGLFEDNDVLDNQGVGFEIRNGANPTLRNNRVTRHPYQGIWIHDGAKGLYEGNDLRGNQKGAWYIAPDCIANLKRSDNEE